MSGGVGRVLEMSLKNRNVMSTFLEQNVQGTRKPSAPRVKQRISGSQVQNQKRMECNLLSNALVRFLSLSNIALK